MGEPLSIRQSPVSRPACSLSSAPVTGAPQAPARPHLLGCAIRMPGRPGGWPQCGPAWPRRAGRCAPGGGRRTP